jgi:Ca-activated chloride channel family protein
MGTWLKRVAIVGIWVVLGAGSGGCSSSSDASAEGLASSPGVPSPTGATPSPTGTSTSPPGGSNVNLGGSQDAGFLRDQLEAGLVPAPAALDAAGFFAEHHIELPPAACGEKLCLQPMMAVMGNLFDGGNCTLLHIGLKSPLAADPGSRPPLSLAVVVDVSGSMQGDKIALVREGLGLLIDGMRDGDRLSLISYSDGVSVLSPLTAVESERASMRRMADGLVAEGGTNLAAGLEAGYRAIQDGYEPGRQHRVILLSDGVPTAGVIDPNAILASSRAYNSDGIGVTTIGLGSDFNVDLMRGLAQQADGNFYFLEDVGAVKEVFEEELSFFLVPVAFDVSLKVEAGSDYDFGRALGTPFWANTTRGGRLDVPSVFLAHRESDDDVTEDDGRRGGGSSLLVELMPRASTSDDTQPVVATLDLDFRDPETDEMVQDSVTVTYPHPAQVLESRGYFDAPDPASIQKSFVMLNIFVGMERAILDFHARSFTTRTVGELDNLIAAVSDYNEEVEDKDIELDLELLDRLRANLVRNGMPDSRAGVPANPWPAD